VRGRGFQASPIRHRRPVGSGRRPGPGDGALQPFIPLRQQPGERAPPRPLAPGWFRPPVCFGRAPDGRSNPGISMWRLNICSEFLPDCQFSAPFEKTDRHHASRAHAGWPTGPRSVTIPRPLLIPARNARRATPGRLASLVPRPQPLSRAHPGTYAAAPPELVSSHRGVFKASVGLGAGVSVRSCRVDLPGASSYPVGGVSVGGGLANPNRRAPGPVRLLLSWRNTLGWFPSRASHQHDPSASVHFR